MGKDCPAIYLPSSLCEIWGETKITIVSLVWDPAWFCDLFIP